MNSNDHLDIIKLEDALNQVGNDNDFLCETLLDLKNEIEQALEDANNIDVNDSPELFKSYTNKLKTIMG